MWTSTNKCFTGLCTTVISDGPKDHSSVLKKIYVNLYAFSLWNRQMGLKGLQRKLPAIYTWLWCCTVYSVVQWPKMIVGRGFWYTFYTHDGFFHQLASTLETARNAWLRSKIDASSQYWFWFGLIDLSRDWCCHCQQMQKNLPGLASLSLHCCHPSVKQLQTFYPDRFATWVVELSELSTLQQLQATGIENRDSK